MPLPVKIQSWKKSDLIDVFEFLGLSRFENGKCLNVSDMKVRLSKHFDSNEVDRAKLASFKKQGCQPSELEYAEVLSTIWLNKNPKFWPPSSYQISNLFGRVVVAIMLFSIPSRFPTKNDLLKFGYILTDNYLKFNLTPSIKKERNVKLMLSSIHK